jgi:hypothetical protein
MPFIELVKEAFYGYHWWRGTSSHPQYILLRCTPLGLARSLWLTLSFTMVFCPMRAQVVQPGQEPATPPSGQSTQESSCTKIATGLSESVRPWDVSLLVIGGFDLYRYRRDGGGTPLSPFGIDREVTESIGRTDVGESFGSRLSAAKTQVSILGGQFLITAFLDMTGNARVTSKDYERTFVFAKAMAYTFVLTELAKNLISRERPDGSDERSFFSGHASGAFVTSSFLSREIDHWIDGMDFARESATARFLVKGSAFTLTYGWAAYVAYSRVYDRKHYLSDVVIGGIVGTTCAHFLYNTQCRDADESDAAGLHLNIMPGPAPTVGLVYRF